MNVPQVPLVLSDEVNKISKTKNAIEMLKRFGIYDDVERVMRAHKMRAGRGKVRGRRYVKRKGPLFVVNDDSETLTRALKNIPGVEVLHVERLNIRALAPGG